MKCVFIIQGEGRGHSTQAIALAQILKELGVEVVAAYIGKNHVGRNHDWVFKEIGVNENYFYSPNFVYKNNEVSLKRTVLKFLKNIFKTRKSIKYLKNELKQINPDFVVNFYEPLSSFAKSGLQIPSITIGHQFLIDHPSYPEQLPMQRKLISFFNKLVSFHSTKIIALSFYPLIGQYKYHIAPPLLRKEILTAKPKTIFNKVVSYVINPDFVQNITQQVFCYLKYTFIVYNELHEYKGFNFKTKKISPEFVDDLLSAEYIVTSGGFETISEANYHEKKILAVPVKNHAEQILNTIDASNRGIILTNNNYDLSKLLLSNNRFQKSQFSKEEYKEWYIRFFKEFLKNI
jgi:uncharacterized protein (TIGR00661 family)